MASFQQKQQQQSKRQQQQQHQQQQLKQQSRQSLASKAFASSSTSGVIRTTATTTRPPAKTSTTTVATITPTNSTVSAAASSALSRRCIFGCEANSAALLRFPAHDHKRCRNWLNFFQIDTDNLDRHGGLSNLRVCLKHFNETQYMAKTRIKTTPTRMQKDAMSSTAKPTAAVGANTEDVKKRLRHPMTPKEQQQPTSTIIVSAPKRTNSISSVTSSISHISDTHSTHSDAESPPPAATTLLCLPTSSNTPKTLNSLLCKSNAQASASHKNRKVFMITEKIESPCANGESSQAAAGQKRKMYLIMEEDGTEDCDGTADLDTPKFPKSTENGTITAKKLTLFADKSDGELTQNFEKILPEILNRIQAKGVATPLGKQVQNGGGAELKSQAAQALDDNNERLPLTLPPKKNRTKIINTNAAEAASSHNHIHNNGNDNGNFILHNNNNKNSKSNGDGSLLYQSMQPRQTSAATPVIVSAHAHSSLLSQSNGQPPEPLQQASSCAPQKNINLSTDFLFLMKMLPKLESIPEPHKSHVKNRIEQIISQNATTSE